MNMNIEIHIIINMNLKHFIDYYTLLIRPIDTLLMPC